MNRVVARFRDGGVLKGYTNDFLPGKDRFHLSSGEDGSVGPTPVEVVVAELKALFFVKTFAGNPWHLERKDFSAAPPGAGRRIRVIFTDGEELLGMTQGYDPSRAGFFVVPADPESNNDRCFVVTRATREVRFV